MWKPTYRTQEIFVNHILDNGLISKSHKKLPQLSNKKVITQLRNGLGLEQKFFEEDIQPTDLLKDITDHQGNVRQNHNEVSPHICLDSYWQQSQQQKKRDVGEDMKKSAPLVTQCEWKMVETLENNTEVPQKIKKKKYHMILQWFRILNVLPILFNPN